MYLSTLEIFLQQVGLYCCQGLQVCTAVFHYKTERVTNCSFVSVSILLELYQQALAKALAQHFDAKLLLLDLHEFSLKVGLFVVIVFKLNSCEYFVLCTYLFHFLFHGYRCRASIIS